MYDIGDGRTLIFTGKLKCYPWQDLPAVVFLAVAGPPLFIFEEPLPNTQVRIAGLSAVILSGECGVLGEKHLVPFTDQTITQVLVLGFQRKCFVCLSYVSSQNIKGRDLVKLILFTVAPRTFLIVAHLFLTSGAENAVTASSLRCHCLDSH